MRRKWWPEVSERSDEELLGAYRAGDTVAFETLIFRYRRPLFSYLLRYLADRPVAEEIYQDVWMRVIERAGDFRGDSRFSTWLYAIARNRCFDHQRRMRLRRHASLDASPSRLDGNPMGERIPSPQAPVDRAAMRPTLQARICDAVEQLPAEQREVFLLRQAQGMSFHEIGEVVGIPVATAKSRMRYALERLQLALDDLAEHARELETPPHEL